MAGRIPPVQKKWYFFARGHLMYLRLLSYMSLQHVSPLRRLANGYEMEILGRSGVRTCVFDVGCKNKNETVNAFVCMLFI